jgi:hypothetical protein
MQVERNGDATASRTPVRAVALPSEHGGWSLTAEPVLLGLLVAWSSAGLALGMAAMLAFVARTPLKLALVDRWRGRWLDRSRVAVRILAAELAVLAMLMAWALAAGEPGFWLPLAFAAPLVLLELWFDMRSRSRRLLPELAGSIGIGSVAAAIALAGGEPTRLAWGLWGVLAARSLAAIPYVRTQIHRAKSQPAPRWHSDLAQVAAVVAATVGWSVDLVPGAAAFALAVAAAVNVVAVRLPPRRAVVIGVEQTIVGLVVVAATAAAVLTG